MPPQTARVASAAATVPQPWRVLGTALQPFSLGHHLLFRRFGFSFADNPEAEFGDDLLCGIAICAADSMEVTELVLAGDWTCVFERWQKRLRGPWWWRNRINLTRAAEQFREYLRQGYERAPVWQRKNPNALEMTAPWEQLLKCRLVLAGFSEREVLTGYLPARWYDYFTVVEIQNAAGCKDVKDWRKMFYTEKNRAEMQAVERAA